MARWSQSQSNPIKEIEISLRGKAEQNGDRMFFRGRKWFISALIKGKGEPADRNYRLDILPWDRWPNTVFPRYTRECLKGSHYPFVQE